MLRRLVLIGGCVVLAACGGEVEDTRPGQPVKTRQTAFKEILKAFEPMGKMLRSDRYDANQFIQLAEQLQARQEAPWAHFGPDTQYPPTKAKAAVWEQPQRFEEEKQAFLAASEALLAATQTRQEAVVKKAYDRTYETCKSCHQTFKEK